jgi:hypothetical protein
MKKLKLNFENLYKLGLTPEICNNNFEEWITKNEDFFIDINNEIIYVGKSNLKNDLENILEFVKNELIEKGISLEDFDSKNQNKKDNMKKRLDAVLSNIPENMKMEFLLNSLRKKNKKMKSLKDKIFSDKIDQVLNYEDEEKINIETDNPEININPYPRVFKDYYSYSVFKKLCDEFGNTKNNLANYSYMFYKMTYEGLIHYDLLHKTYIEMLSEFDISIDRLKPMEVIGNIGYRDSIYAKVK